VPPCQRFTCREGVDPQHSPLRPATLEHTAWYLALATQALAHMDAGLAFGLARIYNTRQGYGDLTKGVMHDITIIEPDLLKMYDEILPRIQTTLGESPARQRAVV
jgi:hypothetical protein